MGILIAGIVGGVIAISAFGLIASTSSSPAPDHSKEQIQRVVDRNNANVQKFVEMYNKNRAEDNKIIAEILANNEKQNNVRYNYPSIVQTLSSCNEFFNKVVFNEKKYEVGLEAVSVEFIRRYMENFIKDDDQRLFYNSIKNAKDSDAIEQTLEHLDKKFKENKENKDSIKKFCNDYCQHEQPNGRFQKFQQNSQCLCLEIGYLLGIFGNGKNKVTPIKGFGQGIVNYTVNIDPKIDENGTVVFPLDPDEETKKSIRYLFVLPECDYKGTHNGNISSCTVINIGDKKLTYKLDAVFVVKDNEKINVGAYSYKQEFSVGVIVPHGNDIANKRCYMLDPALQIGNDMNIFESSTVKFNVLNGSDLQEFIPSYDVVKPYLVVYKLDSIKQLS